MLELSWFWKRGAWNASGLVSCHASTSSPMPQRLSRESSGCVHATTVDAVFSDSKWKMLKLALPQFCVYFCELLYFRSVLFFHSLLQGRTSVPSPLPLFSLLYCSGGRVWLYNGSGSRTCPFIADNALGTSCAEADWPSKGTGT